MPHTPRSLPTNDQLTTARLAALMRAETKKNPMNNVYSETDDGLRVSDILKYSRTLEPGEGVFRFVLLEHNGNRLLVQTVNDINKLTLPALETFPLGEFEKDEELTANAIRACEFLAAA